MKWFRLYNEVYSDPKVQELRPELFRFWINIMCIASENEDRGIVPDVPKLKRLLGLDKPVIQRYLAALVDAELLSRRSVERPSTFVARSDDDPSTFVARSDVDPSTFVASSDVDPLMPHRWDVRQPECDNAAKRKKDSRAKTYDKSNQSAASEMSRDMSQDTNATECDPRVRVRSLDLDRDRDKKPPSPLEGERAFVLPEWVPKPDWNDWLAMRKAKRAPNTPGAMTKAVRDMDKLRSEGHKPSDVLQQSTTRGWTGLFPVRSNDAGRFADQPTPAPARLKYLNV